jgi:hypothetical protein
MQSESTAGKLSSNVSAFFAIINHHQPSSWLFAALRNGGFSP